MASFTQFGKDINLSSREDMIHFLKNHTRYYLANSWNRATSYANNIKIHNLDIDPKIKDVFYDMLDTDIKDMVYGILSDFRNRHAGNYQIAANGRSGGYLVLYHGYKKESQYKSYCTHCGQYNFQPATEDNCRCGRCGQNTRCNFNNPVYEYGISFKSIGDDDFEELDDEELKQQVLLVQDFDNTCNAYIEKLIKITQDYTVKEETVYVPETRRVLKKITE